MGVLEKVYFFGAEHLHQYFCILQLLLQRKSVNSSRFQVTHWCRVFSVPTLGSRHFRSQLLFSVLEQCSVPPFRSQLLILGPVNSGPEGTFFGSDNQGPDNFGPNYYFWVLGQCSLPPIRCQLLMLRPKSTFFGPDNFGPS